MALRHSSAPPPPALTPAEVAAEKRARMDKAIGEVLADATVNERLRVLAKL